MNRPSICVLFLVLALPTFSKDYKEGALIFYERCVLCHGTAGMGEGILPLKLKNYPKTNLLESKGLSEKDIFRLVKFGNAKDDLKLMPPMASELRDNEITAVSQFVIYMISENPAASEHIKLLSSKAPPSRRTGEYIFSTRCVLCHGADATGSGRMARVIKDPPPANLLTSKSDLNYIKKIIEKGGEPMGRSPAMPPWGDQFSKSEIESIAIHILHLRDQYN